MVVIYTGTDDDDVAILVRVGGVKAEEDIALIHFQRTSVSAAVTPLASRSMA